MKRFDEISHPEDGDLRVWHMPNVPSTPFYYSVASVAEAIGLLDALAYYDLHLGEALVYSNAQGLEIWDGREWAEWESADGEDVDTLRARMEEAQA